MVTFYKFPFTEDVMLIVTSTMFLLDSVQQSHGAPRIHPHIGLQNEVAPPSEDSHLNQLLLQLDITQTSEEKADFSQYPINPKHWKSAHGRNCYPRELHGFSWKRKEAREFKKGLKVYKQVFRTYLKSNCDRHFVEKLRSVLQEFIDSITTLISETDIAFELKSGKIKNKEPYKEANLKNTEAKHKESYCHPHNRIYKKSDRLRKCSSLYEELIHWKQSFHFFLASWRRHFSKPTRLRSKWLSRHKSKKGR